MTAEKWQLVLSYPKPPLSLNDRSHWATTAKHVKRLRTETAMRARAAKIPPLPHIHTRLFYLQPDRRRRDEDNLILTAKPCWDGLVDAGVVPDDTSDYMTKFMPRIIGPLKNTPPAIWLEVWTVE